MKYTPTPAQEEDSDHILRYQHAYVWNKAGTGKTLTTLLAFKKGGYAKGVVIGPPLSLDMWRDEIKDVLGMRSIVLYNGNLPPARLDVHGADFLITTWDLAKAHSNLIRSFTNGAKNFNKDTMKRPLSALILDEGHNGKSKDAARTKVIKGPTASGAGGIVVYFDDVWELTGTPVMRHVDDYYAQLRYGRASVMKAFNVDTYEKFVNEFCTKEYKSYHDSMAPKLVVTGSRNLVRLRQLLDACEVLEREEDENMPDVTHRNISVRVKGIESPTIDLKTFARDINKPDGMLANLWRKLGVVKSVDVSKYVASLQSTPILVGYWHTDVMESLHESIKVAQPKWVVVTVNGSTPKAARTKIREDFNAGRIHVILGQMQAMNSSWNIQEACAHVVIAEELPSPGLLEQFFKRVARRGQKNHVHVDHCTSDHPIDKALRQIRDGKSAVLTKLKRNDT